MFYQAYSALHFAQHQFPELPGFFEGIIQNENLSNFFKRNVLI